MKSTDVASAIGEACHANNERNEFLTLFENLPDPIFFVDRELRIVRINQAGTQLIRFDSRAERMFNEDGTGDIQFPWFNDELNLFLGTQDTVSGFQTWFETGTGRRFFQIKFKRMTNAGGVFSGVIVTLYDNTATQRHSEILQRFSMLYENTRDIMFFADEQGAIFEVNQAAIARYGYSRDEMLSLSLRDLLAPDNRNSDIGAIFEASVCNPLHESLHVCKDGSLFPAEVSCSKERVGDAHVFLYIIRDITTRKRIETALKQSREMLQSIIDNVPALVYMKDLAGRLITCNSYFAELLGISRDDLIGKTGHDLFPRDLAELQAADERAVITHCSSIMVEETIRHGDGAHTYLTVKFPIQNESGEITAVCAISTDITARKLAEETARQHHALIEAIIKSPSEIIVFSVDCQYRYTLFNPAHAQSMREIFGAEIKEGHICLDYFETSVREEIRSDLDRALAGNSFRHTRRLLGHDIYYEISVSPVVLPSGEIVGATMFVSDISSSVRTKNELALKSEELTLALSELKEAQARVIQQEKMASIGQLAAGVAHEINNPVGYITSNLNTLKKYAEKLAAFMDAMSETIERHVDAATRSNLEELKRQAKIDYVMKDFRNLISESMEGADRVRKIVQDLKSFSRADSNKAVPSDLNECVRVTANVVRNEIKYVADLDMQLGEIPPVVCHPQQIGQVVMNLMVNAAHAIEQKGTITVTTSCDGSWAKIVIADTGQGIPQETMQKIFEPFFTTKEVGKGTGLGLAISLDIVKKHGGDIAVESQVGKGTTFTVRLPLDGEVR
ncbi:PAS domain S-box protein [Oryzomonas japonica]|uniref:histidine kinase n=1 Tax=Oryzomonas japonica TaxID=2603858 RepID=A0A7J4ZRX4_9BACT|nr:PAS domain S-box protein [Oryzomonas japonica]KAB0666017.1 PAS domain S-box protein [Oryzomonas japonica]